jgi:DNA-binding NtrC family response regulator
MTSTAVTEPFIKRASGWIRTLSGFDGAEPAAPDTGGVPRARVLCVDDNVKVLRVLERQLERTYDVAVAEGSDEAIAVLTEHGPFDVIISDLRMPKVHGLTFLKHAAEIAPDSERIILTGLADPATMAVARSAGGAFKLLTKPCDPDVLMAAIDEAVARRRAKL